MAPNKRVMMGSNLSTSVVDKRRATGFSGLNGVTHMAERSVAPFTCNATGTTTTAVGANAAPGTNDNNVARRGETFQIYNAGGAKKEETVFTVTGIAVAASTTLTYSPASAVAPVSTDVLRWVGAADFEDIDSLQSRLVTLGYTDPQINAMTVNDMLWAVRQADNTDGI
jgi:hypothetical protein